MDYYYFYKSMFSLLYRSVFFLSFIAVFFFSSHGVVEAGNTVSVNRGEVMRPIDWVVLGVPACTPGTSYPNDTPDRNNDIRSRWVDTTKSNVGTMNFGGEIVSAPEGTYQFSCDVPGGGDTATLVVCNNVTNQSDGGSGCVPKAPAAPPPPTAIAAACESGTINVSWTEITGATSYTLRDGATPIYSGNNTSYTHTGLTGGSSHSYTLSVTTAGGTSGYSITNVQNAPGVCSRPNLVVNTPTVSPSTVIRGNTLTITARVDNSGSAAAGPFVMSNLYIDYNNDGNDDYNVAGIMSASGGISAGSNQTISGTWTIPNVIPLTSTARVGFYADVNNTVDEGVGDSAFANWSNWSGTFTVADPIPATPTGLSATPGSCGTGQIALTWSSVAGATSYIIRDGGTYIDTVNTNSYTVTGLVTGSAHSYSVLARNGTGDSAYSSAVAANAPGVCTPPTPSLSASTALQCGGYIDLNWSDSSANYYEVSSDGGASWSNVGNVLLVRLSLSPSITYNGLRVRAVNGAGASAPDNASATASAACTEPVLNSPSHSNVEQTQARVSATIVSDGGLAIIERGFCWGTVNDPGTNCSSSPGVAVGNYTQPLAGLPAGTTLYYRGYAINSYGTGYSSSGSFLTKPATPNNPRQNVASACDSREINLVWDPVVGATSYEVLQDGVVVRTVPGTSYTVPGLNHGQSYNFALRAINATGGSGVSTAAAISAPAECRYPDLRAYAPTLSTTQVRYGDTITFTSIIENAGGEPAPAFTNGDLYIDANNDGNHEAGIPLVPMSSVTTPTPVGGRQTVTRSWTVPVGTPLGTQYRVGYFADRPSTVNEGPAPVWDNWSTWSGYFSVVEPEPEPPTNFVANVAPAIPPSCGGRANLAWDHMTYASRYEINVNGSGWNNLGYVNRISLDTTNGLSAGNNATIQLRAVNATGPSLPASLVVRASNMCTDLFGTTCEILAEQNTCNTATAMWDLTGGLPAFQISNDTNGRFVIGNTVTGSATNIVMRYGQNNIRAYDNNNFVIGNERATWAPTISCAAGLFYHPVQNVCKTIPTIDLSVIPTTGIIRSGNTADIRTRITAGYDLTCSFSNNYVTGGVINHTGGVATDITRTTVPMTAGQIIQINCRVPGNPNPVFTDDIRIEVVTEYSET